MNIPANGVKELSWRDYGRFGYFLPKKLKKGEPFNLKFRFAIEEVDAPANTPKQSDAQAKASHQLCAELYEAFLESLK